MRRISAPRASLVVLLLALSAFAPGAAALARTAAPSAVVTGTVTDSVSGGPLAGVHVALAAEGGQSDRRAMTDDEGRFRMDEVAPGSYRIEYTSDRTITRWYGGGEERTSGALVEVEGTVEASVAIKPAGRLTGTYEGAVLASVALERATAGRILTAQPAANGHFEAWVTTEQPVYLGMRMDTGELVTRVWNGGKYSAHHSTPVQVDSGAVASGFHFRAPASARVTGRTTNSAGVPLAMSVEAYVLEDGEWALASRAPRQDDWTGEFSLAVPAAATVTVRAHDDGFDGYYWTWLGDTNKPAEATRLAVTPGEVLAAGDIVVAGGQPQTVRVVDAAGVPVADVTATLFRDATAEIVGRGTSDTDGRLSIPGLGASSIGPVTVRFTGERIATSWWPAGRNQANARQHWVGAALTGTVRHLPEYQVQIDQPPRISGTGLVGSTLEVDPGIAQPTPSSTAYRWSCGATHLAEGSTYQVRDEDADCAITVQQVARLDGHGTGLSTSSPLTARAYRATSTPVPSGVTTVGNRIRVTNLAWTARPEQLTYQWLGDGRPIAGATGSSYVPKVTDVAERLSVRIRASWPSVGRTWATTTRSTSMVRARTTLRIATEERRGHTRIAMRLSTPGTVTGGYIRVRRNGSNVLHDVRRTPYIQYWSYFSPGWNTISFRYSGSRTATPVEVTKRVYVR